MPGNYILKEVFEWAIHIILAVLIGLFIVTFIAQRTIVDGNSMLPTLNHGDQLIVEKISPRIDKLKRGDLVTVYIPEYLEKGKDYVVKRVVAIGNDTVEIKNGKLFVNGEEVKEDYINGSETQEVNPEYSSLTVPEDCVYILGDNRLPHASLDSRSIGPVKKKRITGKVILRYYPFNKAGWL
ncbi:MAG: signal peptidase I [Firmicutes bacterium]|nr:signal peptidase I [Bacillota bacterium]